MSTGTAVATAEETARFAPPRLPWHPMIEERFGAIGANKASWKALTEAVFPGAKSVDSVVMALSYCAARKLDPFKRPVHIVPMWDSQSRQMVETVWPGISEIRTTAFRTSQYAGCDEVEFGPMIERTFTGMVGRRGNEKEVSITVTFPEWGRINVYRILNGQRCKFVSPKVYWMESYGRQGASDVPNDMWAKRPSGQLEKCVEAAGLRKAFPEEVGNDYTAEEMHGQALLPDATPAAQISGPTPPPPAIESQPQEPAPPANTSAGPAAPPVEDAEIVEPPSPEPKRATGGMNLPQEETELLIEAGVLKAEEAQHPPLAQEEPFDPEAWLAEVQDRFHEARTPADVDGVHEVFGDTANELGMTDRQKYQDMHEAAVLRTAAQGKPEQAEVTGEPGPAPDAGQVQDDEDDDTIATAPPAPPAPPEETNGQRYLARIRNALADPIRTFESIAGLWNATKEERARLIELGQITKAERQELQAAIKARGEQSQAAAPAGPGPSAPPAEEDEVTAYDRSFRARVEACQTTEEIGALSAGTLAERAKFAGNPLQAEWKALVADRRKQIAGLA